MSLQLNLKERVKLFNNEGISFMNDRKHSKIDFIMNKEITILDFDFINGSDGEYVVFIINEDNENFYFGGSVLTANLKELKDEGYLPIIQTDGLPVKLVEKQSKRGRKYVGVEYL